MGVFTTASHTWAVNETVTAANMNAQVKGLIDGFGAWTAYTPVWSASSGTAPSVGNGTLTGKYIQIGKFVSFYLILTAGSTTTFGSGGQLWFTLPAAGPVVSVRLPFLTDYFDNSAGAAYSCTATWVAASSIIACNALPTTAGNANRAVTSTVPFTWATGDILTVSGTYEAA